MDTIGQEVHLPFWCIVYGIVYGIQAFVDVY